MSSLAPFPTLLRAPDAGGGAVSAPAERLFDMTDYFSGTVDGTGVFHDRFNQLRLGFDVTMVGAWEGDAFNLAEDFRYDDGRRQQREWRISRLAGGKLTATAQDIVGAADGTALPGEIRWAYRMRVPVGDRLVTMTFDDRMYLRPDGTLLNVSQGRKFGFLVGRLTAAFRRR